MKLDLNYDQRTALIDLIKSIGHVNAREVLRKAFIIQLNDIWINPTIEIDTAILLDAQIEQKEYDNV